MLEIKNLHVAVDGKEILKGLSLSIGAGEVHAIMGPNGSGKSTLSYVLAGRAGYDITESWELVPGLWTVQLWVGEQKLAEHSFNLVVKDAAARNIAQPQGQPEAISPPGF